MLSETVAQKPTTPVNDGIKNLKNSPKLANFEGVASADPIPVCRQNSVLICRARPAHQLQRAKVRRKKAQSRDPGRHFAPGHEEIFAGVGLTTKIEANAENQREIEDDDDHVHCGKLNQL